MISTRQVDFSAGQCDSPPNVVNGSYEVFNMRVMPDNSLKARGGSKHAHATALNGGAAGYGLTTYLTSAGVTQWVAFAGSKAYKSTDNGATWTEIATGLQSAFWTFTTFKSAGTNYLVCANGDTTMYSWDGTSWATLTGPTTGMRYVAAFNNRLYCAGDSSTLYGSSIADMTTWTAPDGVAIPFNIGTAENIRGIFALGAYLLVFTRSTTNYLDGFGNSDIVVAAGGRGISASVGIVGARAIVAIDANTAVWITDHAMVRYTVGGQIETVSAATRAAFNALNWFFMQNTANGLYPCAVVFPYLDEAWFALKELTSSSTSGCEYIFVYNFRTGSITQQYYGTADSTKIRALALVYQQSTDATPKPNNINNAGFVVKLETTNALDDVTSTGTGGYSYAVEWLSRVNDFGSPTETKTLRSVRLLLSGSNVSFATTWVLSDPSYFTYQGTTDGFDFNTPTSEGGAVTPYLLRTVLRGCSFRVQVTVWSDDGGCNLSIYGYEMLAKPMKRLYVGKVEPF